MDRRSTRNRVAPIALMAWSLAVAGCSTLGVGGDRGRSLVPTGFKTRAGSYLICTNSRIEPDAPVVRQLRAVEVEVQETLGLRVDVGDRPVEVYILDDRDAFDHFLTFYYPGLPHRRAFFLANGDQRVVYTFFGDRVEEDVRHEATHALLHVAVGDIPLWLDEGLAEYFEVPGRDGRNAEHLARLPVDLKAGWTPDLARLESLRSVREMSPRDYRESWAWVHYLLNENRPDRAALLAYLADLRTSPDAEPLSRRLGDPTAAPCLAHLARVRDEPVAVAPARDSTIRLQSATTTGIAEPTPGPPARRKSLISRVFGLFGP